MLRSVAASLDCVNASSLEPADDTVYGQLLPFLLPSATRCGARERAVLIL